MNFCFSGTLTALLVSFLVVSCTNNTYDCATDDDCFLGEHCHADGQCQKEPIELKDCPKEGEIPCGDVCAPCPLDPRIATFTCAGQECVADRCAAGFTACTDGCCPPPLESTGHVLMYGGSTLSRADITVDSRGVPHVGFFDNQENKLIYGTLRSGDWVLTELEGTQPRVGPVEIELGPGEYPRILFCSANQSGDRGLSLAFIDSEGFTRLPVTTPSSGDCADDAALVVDGADRAHVAYLSRPSLTLIHDVGGNPEEVVVTRDDELWYTIAMASLSEGSLHIVYSGTSFDASGVHHWSWKAGQSNQNSFASSGGTELSLARD
ncbi:MAG: hypothetical protein ACNA8W_23970, partial [Bradymonadaceae bacterium]